MKQEIKVGQEYKNTRSGSMAVVERIDDVYVYIKINGLGETPAPKRRFLEYYELVRDVK